jgi:hypothetical protein
MLGVLPKTHLNSKDILTFNRFGTIHLLLQLVPVLNMFFLMSTAVGSGLYSVKEEERRRREEAGIRQSEDQEYTDSPI